MEGLIREFHQKLTSEQLNGNSVHEQFLKKAYLKIIHGMAVDYTAYRENIPAFLSSLETNNSHSVSYSIEVFFEYFNVLTGKEYSKFDLSVLDSDPSDQTLKNINIIFEATFSKDNIIRLSEDTFDVKSLSLPELSEIISLIVGKLQQAAKILTWDKGMVDDAMKSLCLLRSATKAAKCEELLYYTIGNFFERLKSSEYFQVGRDIAEEVVICAYKDNLIELGFFCSFKIYSSIGNVHAALIYANLSMYCALRRIAPNPDRYLKELIWQSVKLFRNIQLYPLAIRIYNSVPSTLPYNDYERRSLEHTYFTLLIPSGKTSLPSDFLDYLNKNREEIFASGIHDALPLLITLYNIKRIYTTADFSDTGLGFYLKIFESIVPPDSVKRYKEIIEGVSPEMKKHLRNSLIKLNETRNSTDFVYDNDMAIVTSNRLVQYSVENNDFAAMLLLMVLKSDYSILFQSKDSKEIAPLILPDLDVDYFGDLYEDKPQFLRLAPIPSDASVNWLAFTEGQLSHLELFNGSHQISNLSDWDYTKFKNLVDAEYFLSLSFSDTVKDTRGVRQLSPEEYAQEEAILLQKLKFATLPIVQSAKAFLVIKDMEISRFPHNLFLDGQGQLIAKRMAVTNVLSTEWLLKSKDHSPLTKDYGKSIWIPTSSGDFTLSLLFSKIEGTLMENNFAIYTEEVLKQPLNSQVNIVCSHGDKDISENHVFYHESNATYNLNKIIGPGKVLVFFVCHSGSMKMEFFRNNVTSLVKRFIADGYESVIAPFWGLDATIPGYWLPEFLTSLDSGEPISFAAFKANQKVYERFPTPAAWACLHLYGNPNLKIAN